MGWGNVAIPELSCTWQRHSAQTPRPAMPRTRFGPSFAATEPRAKPLTRGVPLSLHTGNPLPVTGVAAVTRLAAVTIVPRCCHPAPAMPTACPGRSAPPTDPGKPWMEREHPRRHGEEVPPLVPSAARTQGTPSPSAGDTELLQFPAAIPELALPGATALEEGGDVSPSLAHPTPAWGRGPGTIPARCSPVRGWLSPLGTRSRAPRGTAGHGEGSARAEAPAHAAAFPLKMWLCPYKAML